MNTLSVIARDNERIVSNRYGYSCVSNGMLPYVLFILISCIIGNHRDNVSNKVSET